MLFLSDSKRATWDILIGTIPNSQWKSQKEVIFSNYSKEFAERAKIENQKEYIKPVTVEEQIAKCQWLWRCYWWRNNWSNLVIRDVTSD